MTTASRAATVRERQDRTALVSRWHAELSECGALAPLWSSTRDLNQSGFKPPPHSKPIPHALISAIAALILSMCAAAQQPAGNARVIPESLPLYAQPSLASAVVASLQRGQNVHIDLEVAAPDGTWCHLAGAGAEVGYVPCSQLEKADAKRGATWSLDRSTAKPVRGKQQPASVSRSSTFRSSNARGRKTETVLIDAAVSPEYWMGQLELTDEQRKDTNLLIQSTGLGACRDGLEASFRRSGITDYTSYMNKLLVLAKQHSGIKTLGALGDEMESCGAKYKTFWKAFMDSLSSEQKAAAAQNSRFQMFLMQLGSDPGVELGSYVLSRMSRR